MADARLSRSFSLSFFLYPVHPAALPENILLSHLPMFIHASTCPGDPNVITCLVIPHTVSKCQVLILP